MSELTEVQKAAYDYVDSVVGTADDKQNLMWHGWALREAFEAGYRSAQQCVHPTNGGPALRACINAYCGWVGKESACLTWKHAGDERMCPHCHDNTESIPLSAISG